MTHTAQFGPSFPEVLERARQSMKLRHELFDAARKGLPLFALIEEIVELSPDRPEDTRQRCVDACARIVNGEVGRGRCLGQTVDEDYEGDDR